MKYQLNVDYIKTQNSLESSLTQPLLLDKSEELLPQTLLRTNRVDLSDKIEALRPRSFIRIVRVLFSTYGSNRPLFKSTRQYNLLIFKVIQFITIKR